MVILSSKLVFLSLAKVILNLDMVNLLHVRVNLLSMRINSSHTINNFKPKIQVNSRQLFYFYLLERGNFTSNKSYKFTLNVALIILDFEINLHSLQTIMSINIVIIFE